MELLPNLQRALRRYLQARGVRSDFATVDGRRVHHYSLEGTAKGPPIVLVHGLASSANGFYKLFPALAQRFRRVVAIDLPGNGFSEIEPGSAITRQSQIGALIGFIEEVVREPVFLVGSSLGGAMSVMVAHRRPELVRALGLIAPAGARVAEERLAEVIRAFECRTTAEARALTRRLFHRTPISALLLAGELRRMYTSDAVKAVLAETRPSDFVDPAVLQGLRVPTLLIWGGSEKLLPYEGIEFFREHLPAHAEIRIVRGFGHVPQVERPGALVRHLTAFADRADL